ncbi:MAG: glycoside hydrolase TIM-barrel-like domain-containing protein, partial [Tateyamaria sp.]
MTLTLPALKFGARLVASAPVEAQERFLDELGEGALGALPFLFEFWAMEHQLPPEGDWRTWVIMGGRGAGKTRAGAEWVRSMVEGPMPMDPGKARRVALVGETIEQVREVMVFGESGLLVCTPSDRRPTYIAGRKRLEWPNGAVATIHTAHDPEGLRGPQFDCAWVDELGCAAVDKGTNEPNKFLDPKSSESSIPKYSNGTRDDLIQKQYLRAMHTYWAEEENNPISEVYGAPMVDMTRAFVWAWDARPYPFFPNAIGTWTDGVNYPRGHWINGRTSSRSLASVVGEICDRAGLLHYDTSALFGYVRGYVIDDVSDARSALQPLMLRFAFDAVERDGVLQFISRTGNNAVALPPETLALSSDLEGRLEQSREGEAELAGRVRLRFVQTDGNFEVLSEEAILADDATHAVSTSEIPMALTRPEGRQVAERWLTEARVAREAVKFALPPSRINVGAGDVIKVSADQSEGPALYRVDRVEHGPMQILEGVRIDPEVYTPSELSDELAGVREFVPPVPLTSVFMDLPLLTGSEAEHAPYLAVTGSPWPGSVAV